MGSEVMRPLNGENMNLLKNISFDKLKQSLNKTHSNLINKITETFTGKVRFDEETISELEEILLSADIGFQITETVIEKLRVQARNHDDRSVSGIKELLKSELIQTIGNCSNSSTEIETSKRPYVILVIGVNGSGKTTSIAKLSKIFKTSGFSVLIASADTFRAAANEQLELWAGRVGVPVFNTQSKDPSAVVFDALTAAKSNDTDIVIIDTAGRLHTHKNLMDQLGKIDKVIKNLLPDAPNEILLVLDGNSGQNGLLQCIEFKKYCNITGIVLTKLDGTAKGGIVFNICSELKIPVKYIGVGEGIDDLQTFDSQIFVEALFKE